MIDTPTPSLINKSDEDLYELAYSEINSDSRRQGLWAKALSRSLGDEQKAKALYIQLRVQQLSQSRYIQLLDNIFPFECPGCGKPRAVSGKQIADCYENDWDDFECTNCKHLDDIRNILPYSIIELLNPAAIIDAHPISTPDPVSCASDKWSSGAMTGLVLATIFLPLVGLILGLTTTPACPERKRQANTLLILSIVIMAIGAILMVAARIITSMAI